MSTFSRFPLSFLIKICTWFLGFVPENAVVLSGQSLRSPIRKIENVAIFPSYEVIHWKHKVNVPAAHRAPGIPSSSTLRVFLYLLLCQEDEGLPSWFSTILKRNEQIDDRCSLHIQRLVRKMKRSMLGSFLILPRQEVGTKPNASRTIR